MLFIFLFYMVNYLLLNSCYKRELSLNCKDITVIYGTVHYQYDRNGHKNFNFTISDKNKLNELENLIMRSDRYLQESSLKKLARIELSINCGETSHCLLIYITTNLGTLVQWYAKDCNSKFQGQFKNDKLGDYLLKYLIDLGYQIN